MAKVLAVTNQKGGVGKTTTAVNLSACLAALEQRVLMIDLDPQGNATTGCGVVKRVALPTVYQILIGRSTLLEARITTDFGFDILPANRELAGAEYAPDGLKLVEQLGEGSLMRAVVHGDKERGSFMAGQCACMCDHVQPAAEIVRELFDPAAIKAALTRAMVSLEADA